MMPPVHDVVETRVDSAVKSLTKLVSETRIVLEALEEGQAQIEAEYPDARGPLRNLLERMRSTVAGAISVAAIVPDAVAADRSRGNDAEGLENRLTWAKQVICYSNEDVSFLHGSCTRIQALHDRLAQVAGNGSRLRWWRIADKDDRRRRQLVALMEGIYENDHDMVARVYDVLTAATSVIEAVESTRGPVPEATPERLDRAWRELTRHAESFTPLVTDLEALRQRFDTAIDA
jgi:hypothetical protein